MFLTVPSLRCVGALCPVNSFVQCVLHYVHKWFYFVVSLRVIVLGLFSYWANK